MIKEFLAEKVAYPKSTYQTVGSRTGYSFDKVNQEDQFDFRKIKDRKQLYILYRRDPMCWRVVKTLSALTVARGFKIIPKSDKAKNVIKEFLFRLSRTDPINALQVMIRRIAEDASWSGDAWTEKIYAKKWDENDDPNKIQGNQIIGLKSIHPLTFDFKREINGDIVLDEDGKFGPQGEFLAYTQYSENGRFKQDVDKRRIAHFANSTIGDEILGISDLEIIFKTRHRALNIEEGIAQGAYRHGVPFLTLQVGDELHKPDKKMMDEAADAVKGSSFMSEFVHPPWYVPKLHEQFSLSKSQGILEPFINLVTAASGLPRPVMLGSGEGTNKATIKELIQLLPDTVIIPKQQALKLFIEEQILMPLMEINNIDEVPIIQWNEVFPPDTSIANNIKILSEIMIGGKAVISHEEAREILKFPSEGENTLYSLSKQMLSSQKRGIYLDEPHGRLLHEGNKTSIVTEKNYPGMTGIPLILVSGDQAYGTIKLNKPEQIDIKEFEKMESSHRVSEEEREKWWPDAKNFFLWKFDIIDLYRFSKKVHVPQGVQKFISNVQFLAENKLEINIKNGELLETAPSEWQKKRQELKIK